MPVHDTSHVAHVEQVAADWSVTSSNQNVSRSSGERLIEPADVVLPTLPSPPRLEERGNDVCPAEEVRRNGTGEKRGMEDEGAAESGAQRRGDKERRNDTKKKKVDLARVEEDDEGIFDPDLTGTSTAIDEALYLQNVSHYISIYCFLPFANITSSLVPILDTHNAL